MNEPKFYKPKVGDTIQILGENTDGIHPQFWLNGSPEHVQDPTAAKSRYYMPIIDSTDLQQKILSVSEVGMKALRQIMAEYMAMLERERLLISQASAARRFKQSKLLYRS